jgi:predicted Zn finger-like uncharacterized protein
MSLITRCPQCANAFKLLPDQVRVSQGWARCGSCNAVFDTLINLQSDDANPVRSSAANKLADITSAPLRPAPDSVGEQFSTVHTPSAKPVNTRTAQVIDSSESEPTKKPSTAALRQGNERESQSKTSPPHPLTKPIGFGLVALLAVILTLQWLIFERDKLSAQYPEFKAVATLVCQSLGCKVSPLKQLESVVIEGSSFNKLDANAYQVQVHLRNTSSLQLALPMIELSLTNARDEALLRRVFTMAEMGIDSHAIDAKTELAAKATLELGQYSARIVGYRVLAFYP